MMLCGQGPTFLTYTASPRWCERLESGQSHERESCTHHRLTGSASVRLAGLRSQSTRLSLALAPHALAFGQKPGRTRCASATTTFTASASQVNDCVGRRAAHGKYRGGVQLALAGFRQALGCLLPEPASPPSRCAARP